MTTYQPGDVVYATEDIKRPNGELFAARGDELEIYDRLMPHPWMTFVINDKCDGVPVLLVQISKETPE